MCRTVLARDVRVGHELAEHQLIGGCGRLLADQRWLAGYGAASLLGGLVLLAAMTATYLYVVGDLIVALFGGTVIDILLGIYYVAPIALGIVLSTLGLLLEIVLGAATRAPDGDAPAQPDAPT